MALIHVELFATLDLVGQSPGGPDEDLVGFPFGCPPARGDRRRESCEVGRPEMVDASCRVRPRRVSVCLFQSPWAWWVRYARAAACARS
jgi:hypothetical protein